MNGICEYFWRPSWILAVKQICHCGLRMALQHMIGLQLCLCVWSLQLVTNFLHVPGSSDNIVMSCAKKRALWTTDSIISVIQQLIQKHDLYLVGIICDPLKIQIRLGTGYSSVQTDP